MAKAARKAGVSAPLPTLEQFEGVAAFNNAATEALMKASRAYWDALSELNGELSGFFTKRLQHDMELGQSMAGCNDLQEIARLQQDWARTAMEDYAAEATKLLQLYSRAGTQGWQTFCSQASAGSKSLSRVATEQGEQEAQAA